jgi:serine/threonine protein kinase
VFARKIISQSYSVTRKDIDTEAQTVEKLCTTGHENIVNVLKQGWLEENRHYYIDMDLCDANLDTYIRSRSTIKPRFCEPVFISAEDSPELHVWNMWTICSHISNGLAFIHKMDYIHRDLTPRNSYPQHFSKLIIVLYSDASKTWKIADFGIASKVSISKPLGSTTRVRGTPGFCAPELLSQNNYGVQVDIWALGCILYQLCTKEPLLSDDFGFDNPKCLDLQLGLQPSNLQSKAHISYNCATHISACLNQMLMRDPQSRPSASSVQSLCDLYCVFCDPLFSEIQSFSSPYSECKDLVSNTTGNRKKVIKRVVKWAILKEGRFSLESLLKASTRTLPRTAIVYELLEEWLEERTGLTAFLEIQEPIVSPSRTNYRQQTDSEVYTPDSAKYNDFILTKMKDLTLNMDDLQENEQM